MKICIVTPILFPEPGGPSTFVDRFTKSLRKDRHSFTIVAISEGDDFQQDGQDYSVIKIRRKGPLVFRIIKTVQAIVKYGRKSDVLFSCGLFLESALAKRIVRKPLIIRIGGDPVWEKWTTLEGGKTDLVEFNRKRYSLKIEFMKYLQRIACRTADQVIANSIFLKNIMGHWGIKEDQIKIVYNGIDEEEIKFECKESLRERYSLTGKIIILTVGRLIELKRIDEIIQSFSEVRGDPLELFIIGEGPKRQTLMTLAEKLNLSRKIRFLGIKSHEEVLRYLRAADLFVLNSVNEVMPNVVLESLAVGTPVIAPSVGGIPEIIENNVDGLLFERRESNINELKKAMERLLTEEKFRNQLIKNGLAKIGRFDWKSQYRKTMATITLK